MPMQTLIQKHVRSDQLYTTGQLAALHAVPVHRILYALKRHAIAPCGRAAHVYLYDQAAAEAVGQALQRPSE